MKKIEKFVSSFGIIGVLSLPVAVLILSSIRPIQAQSVGTRLQLGAFWDNGAAITGTVKLSHVAANNAAVTDFGQTTSGWVNTTLTIQPNVLYTATLTAANPLTNSTMNYSVQFLVPGLIIDPTKIVSAAYKVTINRTTNLPVPGETRLSVEM